MYFTSFTQKARRAFKRVPEGADAGVGGHVRGNLSTVKKKKTSTVHGRRLPPRWQSRESNPGRSSNKRETSLAPNQPVEKQRRYLFYRTRAKCADSDHHAHAQADLGLHCPHMPEDTFSQCAVHITKQRMCRLIFVCAHRIFHKVVSISRDTTAKIVWAWMQNSKRQRRPRMRDWHNSLKLSLTLHKFALWRKESDF